MKQEMNAAIITDSLIRLPRVLEIVGVSASTWWTGCRRGVFPAPVRLGKRCTAWRMSDINKVVAGEFSGEKNKTGG